MRIDVKKFARLARIKLNPRESKTFGEDLKDILNYFEELQDLDTKKVSPMTGGTDIQNVFRDDELNPKKYRPTGGTEQFPEQKDGYLKVPKVFE